MVRTQIQLTEDQMAALKALSSKTGRSVAEIVRRGVDCVLDVPHEPSPAERRQRARAAFGRFRSGVADLASRHDDYLAEAYEKGGRR